MEDRVTCTAENPVKPGQRAQHPAATEIECPCDCCARYKCPHCGLEFQVELPQ